MKAVLISIRPEWCEKICGGEKTIDELQHAIRWIFEYYQFEV